MAPSYDPFGVNKGSLAPKTATLGGLTVTPGGAAFEGFPPMFLFRSTRRAC